MTPEQVQALIESGMPDAAVRVESPDNTHFEAVVVADAFVGLSRIARHKLVYRCLGERMGREIHALSLKAVTREEYQAAQSQQ